MRQVSFVGKWAITKSSLRRGRWSRVRHYIVREGNTLCRYHKPYPIVECRMEGWWSPKCVMCERLLRERFGLSHF